MSDFNDTKSIIAQNLAALRREKRLSQREVAKHLNYSDKAVSKWERGESLPDISVLKNIADFYGVTIDELTSGEKRQNIFKRLVKRHKLIIPLLSAGLVWLVVTIAFVFVEMFTDLEKAWLGFIYAIPLSMIVLLVFNAIWGNKALSLVIVSLIIWTVPLSAYLTISGHNSWLLFLIAIPLQVLNILWFLMRIKPSKRK